MLVGLVLAEGAFWLRDGGAFPHVNFYEPDPELGVRLTPHSTESISFGGNPVTHVAVNSQGYRGPEWPAPSEGEVLVVGDSQVFGLGVEQDQTTPAHLAAALGTHVINGGVPTYGPDEYLAVVDAIATGRKLKSVVLVINFSNDLFEVHQPNRNRHAVWDGWAVRTETAPASVTWFPGRSWLYSRSHAFFALRKLLHQATEVTEVADAGRGFASEGSVRDVLTVAASSEEQKRAKATEQALREAEHDGAYRSALAELGDQNDLVGIFLEEADTDDALKLRAAVQNSSVGDIVYQPYAESSRRIDVTAEILAEGARLRRNLRAEVRELAQRNPYLQQQVNALLNAKDAVPPEAANFELPAFEWATPLDPVLDRFAALASKHGFEPMVVALPLDVQVLSSQFAKYGAEPIDLSGTSILFDDLERGAVRRQMRFVQPSAAIAAVGDAAYLKNDLHLSDPGHQAVATVIAAALKAPPPPIPPASGIVPPRTRIPWADEWEAANESLVKGSSVNRCMTRRVREWFRMDCRAYTEEQHPVGMHLVQGPLEAHGWYDGHDAVLIAPVLEGRTAEVDFIWTHGTQRFRMEWVDGKVRMAFHPTEPAVPDPGPQFQLSPALITPEETANHGRTVTWVGAGSECGADEACLFGTRTARPTCSSGLANAGSAGHCFASCSDEVPCSAGVCTPWGPGSVCL